MDAEVEQRLAELEVTLHKLNKKREKLKQEQAQELAATRSLVETLRQGLTQAQVKYSRITMKNNKIFSFVTLPCSDLDEQDMYQRAKMDLEKETENMLSLRESAKQRKQKIKELEEELKNLLEKRLDL